MIRSLGLFFFLLYISPLKAQLETSEAMTRAHSGFLYYDSEKAMDRKERVYRYTIAPPQANCIQLNFHLQSSELAHDFIRVFKGKGIEGPELASLGGLSGGKIIQVDAEEVTIEFRRDAQAMVSAWTLFWNSDQEGECIEDGKALPNCPELREVCGPVFKGYFPDNPHSPIPAPSVDSCCIAGGSQRFWYKFMVQSSGELGFSIHAKYMPEDLDWALWRADSGATAICPSELQARQLMACNQASGIGARGQTGMSPKGNRLVNAGGQNPWSAPLQVEQGQVFFLLIQPPANSKGGFEIQFNETVLQCEPAERKVLPIDQRVQIHGSKTNVRMFSLNVQSMRIDLQEKANHPLRDAPLDRAVLSLVAPPKPGPSREPLPSLSGLPGLLLWGLQTGRLRAEAPPSQLRSKSIHFGDVLDMAYRTQGTTPTRSYWSPDPDLLAPMAEVIDLELEDNIEIDGGRRQQYIRNIRLVWFDPTGDSPGFYVAKFAFSRVRPYLEAIEVAHPRNEAATLSLADLLDQQLYHGFLLATRNRRFRNLSEANRQKSRRQEFESYQWSR